MENNLRAEQKPDRNFCLSKFKLSKIKTEVNDKMEKHSKKIISILLCMSMLISLAPTGFASSANADAERSYFDFEASEYEVKENAGELKIKVVRRGEGNAQADVAFKAADFLSSYGEDYEVLDANGNPLDKVYGEKPSVSDFEYEGDTDELVDIQSSAEEAQNESNDDSSNSAGDKVADSAASDSDIQLPKNVKKKLKSTGSSLRDAQAAYLNIPEGTEDKETESAVKDTLDDMYNYFLAAEGASGVIHFNKGENEKTITVKVIDNSSAQQNKIFMLALMGTDNDETMTAANATTYVTIVDDEAAEKAQFDLVDSGLTLTNDAPEGYITVRRSGGTQYFATVYVSTVKGTADPDSYENFEYKPVAFVPGETEKNVSVKATDFSKDGKFGVRLEAETNADVGVYYATINISASEKAEALSTDVALAASNITLGSSSKNFDVSIPGGWKKDITCDGSAWESGGYLHIKQYDNGKYTMYVSNSKLNLIGNKDITYSSYVTNTSRGFNTKYKSYSTWFETDSDQTFSGSLNSIKVNGNSNWTERTLSLNNTGDSAYLKFATKPSSGGYDNPEAILDWIRFNYAKYTFSPQNSAETFNRMIYDFTQGTPNVYDTYYDGETAKIYNPGSVVIKRGNDTVSAFYGDNISPITITAANEAKNRSKGIYLKGVYFANDNLSAHTMYLNGKYTNKNVYYVSAENGRVNVTPNQNFIKELHNRGVISDVHSDRNIKIYPVFAREEVEFHFENTDRDDTKAATKGKFDKTNKASYIINVLEACDKGNVKKGFHADWLDYYYMKVPKYSVIRVQTQPISTRTANGVYWWSFDGARNGITYHKENDVIASGTNPNGETVVKTDYTKADIVLTEGLCIKPATGTQTFDVGYFPTEKESIPDEYKSENGLTNAVVPTDEITSGSSTAANGTDKNGKYSFKNPFIGMDWSLTAIAPNGYYTQWINMTGDENEDGYVDANEASKIKNRSSMPDEVYGNVLSGKLDQDNFRLNYYFLQKTSSGNGKKTGTVVRAPENFYQLAKNIKSDKADIPIAAAYVDVGGFRGLTDGKGRYSILCNDLPSAGNVSTTITTDDNVSYNTISKLQRDTYIKLDALSKFKATGLDAYYDKTSGAIAGDFITVNDDTLTIETSVSSDSAVVPVNAQFFIYDEAGTEKYALTGRDGYKTSVERNGNELTAYLEFNPKKDMQLGYKIYVQFADQNNEWTNAIDLGYYFSAKLSLAEFIFPLIGSSSFENLITTGFVEDVIGDPLSDIDLGTIKGFEESSESYTPSGINKKNKQDYTWQKNQYRFGWSNEFYDVTKKSNKDKDKDKLAKYLKAIYDGKSKGKEPPTPGKYKTKSRFKWSITPSVGFNLTLSSRKDGNTYFEDLVFYAKADFELSASQKIKLPIGLSILVKGSLDGNIAGIYHMYVDYQDSYETEDAVKYTSEDFGLFKKFNNSVRREGYIFIDPSVSVALGVGCGIVFVTGNASFNFDMDFQFTEIGTNAYGDITIDLGWGIQLFNFEVYSKSLYTTSQKLFNTEGTDGHINFDYNDASTLSLLSVSDFFAADDDEKLVLDRPSPRNHLANGSEWLGDDSKTSLAVLDGSGATKEKTLMENVLNNPYVKLAELDDGKILMVFIEDNRERSVVNKRTLYYCIYNSGSWSVPKFVDDDGTLDDYPNICDLGDGRILVTWSSADKVLEDGATVEQALKSMNIKATFFDKKTCTFGDVMQVTHTTGGDYCADTMANAAYDKDTDRLILYYTKTEYNGLDNLNDLSNAYSANAYMFYENGKWSEASDYTDDELLQIKQGAKDEYLSIDEDGDGVPDYTPEQAEEMAEAYKEQYKNDWYGQRFLDVRTDKDGEAPRVTDTSSINYNGLALFAWTVDWDGNLDTPEDRDVFMQIYNFAEDSFTHIIRVTTESAAYASPKFARSNNATYLFFGEIKTQDGSEAETELAEHGAIRYINVSDLIRNDRFTKITDGVGEYYIFKYEREAYVFDENSDKTSETPTENLTTETVLVEPGFAADCDNTMDYDVKVSDDGQMYLFWTDAVDGSRQVMTAVYNGTDENDDDEAADANKDGADLSDNYWSEPVMLTNAAEGEYYSGIGATAVNGEIYVLGARGKFSDSSDTKLVEIKHTPFGKIKAESVELIDEIPQPLSDVTLRATIKNEGLLKKDASDENPIPVIFTVNGENPVAVNITKPIPGGSAVGVECSVTLPEDISNVEFEAFTGDDDKVSTKLEQKSSVKLLNSKLDYISSDGYNSEKVIYSAVLENNGNTDISDIAFTATIGEAEVGSAVIDTLPINEVYNIEIELSVPDSAYALNADGVGSADVNIDVASNGESLTGYNGTVQKTFSAEAIEALSKVTAVTFDNDGIYSMKVNGKQEIQPTIEGDDDNSLMIMWLESSDSGVARIDYDNMISADGSGTATLTGIVVPSEEKIEFTSGKAKKTDWRALIPSDILITVTATVNVTGASGGHGSGGSSSSRTQYTLTFDAANGSEAGTIKVNKDGTVSELPVPIKDGYKFDGWYTDEALTVPFTSETKVTSDLRLYAKWIEDTKDPDTDGNATPFKDITENDWFYNAVRYVYENKLFNGISNDMFAPQAPLTRAMLVTVLWRADGMPETDSVLPFEDIESDGYYLQALRWAASEGIVEGISETEFAPNDNITREQIAAIMFRYAKLKGKAPEGAWAILLDYNDVSEISDWAAEAVMFCKLKGIMTGDDTNAFNPKNNATRAETAAVTQRFTESLKNN